METIGVFFGSRSTEHDISIITAQLIISGLKGLGKKIVPVYIDKQGNWLIDEVFGTLGAFTSPHGTATQSHYKQYYLDLEESHGKLVFKKKGIGGKNIVVDMAFPAFHGPFGEDGTIQGLFEMFNVPYVGCDVASSAIAMDKVLTKQICDAQGIPNTKYIYFYARDWQSDKQGIITKISKNLNYPVFVKPVHLGSSIGISRVESEKELQDKIELALYYDDKVSVEEGVANLMDVTCCLLGNDEVEASVLQESVFQADLFDFEEKYLHDGGGQFGKGSGGIVIPARIDAGLTKEIQEAAKAVYRAVGCSGIARVDFLLDTKTKKFFANEINPLPGTIYHHLWQKSGIELPELLTKLLDFAAEKHSKKQNIAYTYNSSVLTGLGSKKLGLSSNKLGDKS